MSDTSKTKAQLLAELEHARRERDAALALAARHEQAEQSLAESRRRFAAVLESLPVVVYTADCATNRFLLFEGAVERLTGYPADAFYADPELGSRVIHEEDRPRATAAWEAGLRSRRPFDVAFRILHGKDGGIRWMYVHVVPELDDRGGCVRQHGVITDVTEQKRTEVALRESQYRLAEAEQVGQVGHWAFDCLARERYWMNELRRLRGGTGAPTLPPDEAFLEAVHPGDRERMRRLLQSLHTHPRPFKTEFRIMLPDGSVRFLHEAAEAAYDTAANQVGLCGTVRDITERRAAEEALRESEERFREFVEGTADLITQVDAEGRLLYVNHAAESVFGLPPEDCAGLSAFDFVHPEDRDRMRETTARWLRDRVRSATCENRQVSCTGEVRHMLWNISLHYDERGNLTAANGIGRDITEHKRAEEALRQERDRAAQYLAIAGVILVALDREGTVTLINRKGCEVLGLEEDEIVGTNWFDRFLPESLRKQVRTEFGRLMEESIPNPDTYENPVLSASGKERIILWRNALLRDREGRVIGTLSSGEDVTERRRAEEALRRASRLEAAATLAGGIAHDFNNLMVGVLGNAELLKMGLEQSASEMELLGEITHAARRAGDLAQQLLAFARGGKYNPCVLDLNQVILDAGRLQERFVPPGIRLDRELAPDLRCVHADPTQMNQVVMNLGLNAIEAVGQIGRVVISTRNARIGESDTRPGLTPGEYVRLSVEDTGKGMDAETLARIFEPFFTTKAHGRGLGLAATYGIVTNHGGAILVESAPGRGTRFDVYLPATNLRPEPESRPATGVPAGDETILLIEDEELVANVTRKVLRRLGYEVLVAPDGERALELVRAHEGTIHLAVLDMTLPGAGGAEVFAALKEARPEIRIVICSGYEMSAAARALLAAGASAYVQKPFEIADLSLAIRKALDE